MVQIRLLDSARGKKNAGSVELPTSKRITLEGAQKRDLVRNFIVVIIADKTEYKYSLVKHSLCR